MQFRIDEKIFQQFPGLQLGVVIAKGIDNTSSPNEIPQLLREQEERIKKMYSLETLSQESAIDVWRKAYSSFGAKPKEHKSSVENLYRAVLGGREVHSINPLVDLYNYVSLEYMVPVGGEDLDTTHGDIVLAIASDHESPALLLGDKEPRTPHVGEVMYKDDVSAICRRWNWREADRTKLTESTKNAILVIEALPPVNREVLTSATRELNSLVREFCGATAMEYILDAEHPTIEL